MTGETIVDNPNVVGAGLENLFNAVQASVSLDPVSVAFGGIPSGSGQNRSGEIIVKNLTDSTATFEFSIEDPFAGGASYTVSPASVTLAPGATTTIRVTRRCAEGIPAARRLGVAARIDRRKRGGSRSAVYADKVALSRWPREEPSSMGGSSQMRPSSAAGIGQATVTGPEAARSGRLKYAVS